jgi:phospholipid/cholesterol/gamma-HCH transport system ATP-binding protein
MSLQDTPVAVPEAMRVQSISKRFGRLEVLRELSLSFPRGQTTVVMGPSGCGKSVMLKHLVGLLRPDAGEVWFGSVRIDALGERGLGPVRRQIGFLFQQSALFDSMSVHDNVAFPLREHGVLEPLEVDRRVDRVLHLVGLEDTRDQMPSELSGGQRKRIALARAVVLEPQVVLYDEPTTGLDPIRSDIINELILKLNRTLGVTSIVVTHDLSSAFKVADRMVMLHEGRVRLEGTPELFRTTDDPIVQRFLRGEASPEELARIRKGGDHATLPLEVP